MKIEKGLLAAPHHLQKRPEKVIQDDKSTVTMGAVDPDKRKGSHEHTPKQNSKEQLEVPEAVTSDSLDDSSSGTGINIVV